MKPPLLRALNLSKNEKAVLDALLVLKMARNVSVIARQAGLPRTTTLYILKKFEKRKLSKKAWNGAKYVWMFDKTTDYVERNMRMLKA